MLNDIRLRGVFEPFRGRLGLNTSAVADVLLGLSIIAKEFPEIREIDINPLIIQPDGNPVAARCVGRTIRPLITW